MACCQDQEPQISGYYSHFGGIDTDGVYVNYAPNNPLVQAPATATAQPQTHWVLWLAVLGAGYYWWKHAK